MRGAPEWCDPSSRRLLPLPRLPLLPLPPLIARVPAPGWAQAGNNYDQATGLAADLRIKPSFDESMQVRCAAPRCAALRCAVLCCHCCNRSAPCAPGPAKLLPAQRLVHAVHAVHSCALRWVATPTLDLAAPCPVRCCAPLEQVLVGGSAAWQRRDTTYGGNVSTEFRLPKGGGRGGKSDTTVSANAQYTNKGSGTVSSGGEGGGGGRGGGARSGRPAAPCLEKKHLPTALLHFGAFWPRRMNCPSRLCPGILFSEQRRLSVAARWAHQSSRQQQQQPCWDACPLRLTASQAPFLALPPAKPPLPSLSPRAPQVVLRISSHDYPALAASMAVPVLRALWDKIFSKEEF